MIERKGEIDKSTITVGNFNTNFSSIDTTKRPKKTQKQINKDIGNLKSMINWFDLMEIYKTLYLTSAEYLPLKAFQEHKEHFQNLTLCWEIKQVFNQFKRIVIIWRMFSDYISVMLEINLKRQLKIPTWLEVKKQTL